VAPLRGLAMEHMALRHIREALAGLTTAPTLVVREATEHEDVMCAVDIVVERVVTQDAGVDTGGEPAPVAPAIVLGIQVKPESVLHRKCVMEQNRQKQETFGAPVTFMVYDRKGVFRPTANGVVKGVGVKGGMV